MGRSLDIKNLLRKIWWETSWRTGVAVRNGERIRLVPYPALNGAVREIIVNPIYLPRFYAILGAIVSYASLKYEYLKKASALKSEEFFNKLASYPVEQVLFYADRYRVILPCTAVVTIREEGLEEIGALVSELEAHGWRKEFAVKYAGRVQVVFSMAPEKRREIEEKILDERESLEENYEAVFSSYGLPRRLKEQLIQARLGDLMLKMNKRIDNMLKATVEKTIGTHYTGEYPLTDTLFVPREYGGIAETIYV